VLYKIASVCHKLELYREVKNNLLIKSDNLPLTCFIILGKKPKFRGRKAFDLRYLTCSILLFLALSSQLGTYVVYVVQQELNKENIAQQMARKLPEENLVKIKNSHKIKWEEAGKEFYLEGVFYDIVTTKKIDGETWFYCINDKMESQLYNHYTASFKTNTDATTTSKEGKQVLKFSLSYFLLYTNDELVSLQLLKSNHFSLMTQGLNTMVLKVNAPPPRMA
jgi:hypothetical protein